jgi:hypothetical protein
MNPAELVAYCGAYCGNCALAQDNVQFGVNLLKEINAEFGPTKAVDSFGWEPMRNLGKYATENLDHSLASLTLFAAECFPKCCTGHCVPPCEIARCVPAKGYRTCAECDEMNSCEKLDKHRDAVSAHLDEIKKHGLTAYASIQAKAVVEQRKQAVQRIMDELHQGTDNIDGKTRKQTPEPISTLFRRLLLLF